MAQLLLNENFEEALSLMKQIGDNGPIKKEYYKMWLLFIEFRKRDDFKEIYKEIFNEDYKVLEIPDKPLIELLKKEINKDPNLKKELINRFNEKQNK